MNGFTKLWNWFCGETIEVAETKVVTKTTTVTPVARMVEQPPKPKLFNPLNIKVGNTVKIDSLDYRDLRFNVKAVENLKIPMNDETHEMVDYVLEANGLTIRLRAVPHGESCKTAILHLDDEFEYAEPFHDIVRDSSKEFNIDEENAKFFRLNDVGISYAARINDCKAIEFWDYSRKTMIDDVELEEFIFVEMSSSNGWFQIWRGLEVDPTNVNVF